ncbi:hypothetical protein MUP05_00415 [Candidatus Bathyarchaeota archaeon]|nr:hypothetical protein [Candidatus Bathyarchaeota archaeon]
MAEVKPPGLPCGRNWGSVRPECRKCDQKMSCRLYVEDWKKKKQMQRRGGM